MDIQILLISILFILTICLVIVSIYVIIVLKDLRKTIQHANEILAGAEKITSAVSNPAAALINVITTVVETAKAVKSLKPIRTIADLGDED